MKRVRQVHVWLGLFFAPAILFFASSGVLMTLGLHKAASDGSREAPSWIAELADVHRKQRLSTAGPRNVKPAGEKSAKDASPSIAKDVSPPKLFRAFVVTMAAGIVVTTILGLQMAFAIGRNGRLKWAVLVAGVALPVTLLVTS
jgi:hypothetical protein